MTTKGDENPNKRLDYAVRLAELKVKIITTSIEKGVIH